MDEPRVHIHAYGCTMMSLILRRTCFFSYDSHQQQEKKCIIRRKPKYVQAWQFMPKLRMFVACLCRVSYWFISENCRLPVVFSIPTDSIKNNIPPYHTLHAHRMSYIIIHMKSINYLSRYIITICNIKTTLISWVSTYERISRVCVVDSEFEVVSGKGVFVCL